MFNALESMLHIRNVGRYRAKSKQILRTRVFSEHFQDWRSQDMLSRHSDIFTVVQYNINMSSLVILYYISISRNQ